MKKVYSLLVIMALTACFAVYGKTTGININPGIKASATVAEIDLNKASDGSGSIIFSTPSDFTKIYTTPQCNNAAGMLSDPLIFLKNKGVSTPLIIPKPNNGYPSSITQDRYWKLLSSDYFTVNGVNVPITAPDAPTATIGTTTGVTPGSATYVDITLSDFGAPISGFQFTIRFDTNYLKYSSVTNWASGISGVGILHNYYGSIDALTFVWGDAPVTVNGLFCRINFTYKASASGCKTVIWSDMPTPRLFADDNYNEFTVTYVDGQICSASSCSITLSSAVGTDAQTKCINTAITDITYTTSGATGATITGLPAGVTGSWASNVVTISGTPTASGTYIYTVTTVGCGPESATGTITVTPDNTITLTSGGTQTVCINNPITTTTYTTTGATGATATGLPAGVTGSWVSNVVTISGTPTASGTFNYTVTLTGGCGSVSTTGTITVNPENTLALTAGGTQTVCVNTPVTTTTYATTGATGATVTGLPAGVTGSWSANVVTISGTPTAAGTYNYTVTLTGGCGTISASGTITVSQDNTITLTAGGTQTACINTAITTTTYATTGATGATITGLPAGVTGSWASNVVTISGSPTAIGTYNYTVTTTGGCGTASATGTITVIPDNTISLTAGGSQTVCISTPVTTTTYGTTGATGATVTGLPAGVTGSWAADVVTISGTPTADGTYNYTVTLTGGCGNVSATGTITVTPDNTITLTAGGTQTLCINTPITTTTYATTGATGATITGLPAGVTGSWASDVVTITGTPTADGTYNYTVTLTGGCGTVTANGTITVTTSNTITLTTGGTQTACINTPVTTTTYTTTGATGATVTGLPAGVTGSWASDVVTISGTPTAAGTYNYTVSLTGGCGVITATGTITVSGNNTLSLTAGGTQTVSVNTPITTTTYATTGATGATITGLPAGVTGSWASNVVTISGTPTAAGTYNYTVTTTGGCGTATATGTITVTSAAAPTATIETITGACPGDIANVDVTLSNFNAPISGFQYTIRYDTNYLHYVSTTNWAAGISGVGIQHNYYGSIDALTFVWGDTPVSVSGLLSQLNFIYKAPPSGCHNIIWSDAPTPRLFADDNYNEFTVTYVDGMICPIAPEVITGTTPICIGATETWTSTTSGGTWTSSAPTIATVDPATGVVTGIAAGTSLITYAVTIGSCVNTATQNVTILPVNTITLTAGGTQTVPVNTPITTTTYATTGATGATVTGLPAGVTGSWATDVVTISGTPTAAGTYNYTVTTTGGCGTATATGTITVTSAAAPTATIETITGACPGDIANVDVTLSNFNAPISGFQYTIRYDTNYLHYVSTTNWAAGISGVGIQHNYYGSIDALTFVWGDTPVSVSGLLSQLNFIYKAPPSGCHNIIWSDAPTPRLFADDNYNEFTVTYVDGMICPIAPEVITGTTPICVGSSETWTSTTTGGTWTSSAPTIATVDPATGVVTGIAAGTSLITYAVTIGSCVNTATQIVTITAPTAQTITGTTPICVGSSETWTSTTTGGTWSSADPLIAAIDASTGAVTGIAAGTALISYTLTEGVCVSTTTKVVTIGAPIAQTITGTTPICVGASETWTSTTTGGTWISSDPLIATIDVATGVVTGIAAGTSLITYAVTVDGCVNTATQTVTITAPVAQTITGTTPICTGATETWSSTTSGGTWSSSAPTIATVDPATGVVTGIAAGTSLITYSVTVGPCTSTATQTVTITAPTAQTITGTTPICVGSAETWTSSTSGGTWTSSDPLIATIDASTGVVTGIAAGTSLITYSVTVGACICTATQTVTISGPTAQTITGTTPLCVGSTENWTSTTTGGTWTSSDPLIATIDGTTGVVTGVAGGTSLITYIVTVNGCVNTATQIVTITSPIAQTITGLNPICMGAKVPWSSTTPGGTWTSSNVTIATVDDVTGLVTGLAAGTSLITYSVTIGGCVNTATRTVTVLPDNTVTLTTGGSQTVIVNTPITTTTYNTTGATGATITGLPAGVTGSWAADVVTISGTPTATGTYNYTVATTGGCGTISTIGTITVITYIDIIALCHDTTALLDINGNVSITPDMVDNGSFAIAGIASMTVTPNAFSCGSTGPNLVVLTVTDNLGNTATCSATVMILDTIPPIITCPPDVHVNNVPGLCSAWVNYMLPTYTDNCSPDVVDPIVNGSFETGNYSGWTIWCSNTYGTWGIGNTGQTLNPGGTMYDYYNNANEIQGSPGLPITFAPTDGTHMGVFLQNGPAAHRLYQDVTLPYGNIYLNVDLKYTDHSVTGFGSTQFIAINLKDPISNMLIEQLFITSPGDPASIPMTSLTFNVSSYAGQNVRLEIVESNVTQQYLDVLFDNIKITGNYLDMVQTTGLPSGSIFPVGTTVNTFLATDSSGNTSTCSFNVVVTDNRPPTALCQNITMPLDANGNAIIAGNDIDNGSHDECGIASLVAVPNTLTCANVGTPATVTLTVTDNNGNTSTCTALVTVLDNTPPTAICHDTVILLDISGNASIVPSDVDGGSSDACGIASMSVYPNTFTTADLGPNTVTLTVTDINGNSSTCTAIVTITFESNPPTALCHDTTVYLDATGNVMITPDMVDDGSWDDSGIGSMIVTPDAFTCAEIGPNTVTLTVTDLSGNSATCTAIVTVLDTIPPALTCSSDIITGNDPVTCGAIVNYNIPIATDNCGTINLNPIVNGSFETGDYTGWNLFSSVNGYFSTWGIGATGQVISPSSYFFDYFDMAMEQQFSPGLPYTCAPTDGNYMGVFLQNGMATHRLYQDLTLPNGNISLNFDLQYANHSGGGFSASQYISVNLRNPLNDALIQQLFVTNPGDPNLIPMTPFTFNIAPYAGQNIRLEIIEANISSYYFDVMFDNIRITGATGGSSVTLVQTAGLPSGSLFPIGTTTNTFVATDVSGNTATCSFDVTVNDVEAPTAICQDVTVYLDASGNASITPAMVDNGSYDNPAPASTYTYNFDGSTQGWSTVAEGVTCSGNAVSGNNWGLQAHAYTGTNSYGNTNVGSSGAENSYIMSPVLTLSGATTIEFESFSNNEQGFPCNYDVEIIEISTDNGMTWSNLNGSGIANLNGVYADAQWRSISVSTNVSNTTTGRIRFRYDTGDDYAGLSGTNLGWYIDDVTITTAPTPCSTISLAVDITDFDCTDLGSNNVTLTVTDSSGNTATCTSTVTVLDTVTPIITCADYTRNTDPGVCEYTVAGNEFDPVISNENCPSPIIWNSYNFGSTLGGEILPTGTTNVTWIVSDMSGNSDVCQQIITITDTEPPALTCPADIHVNNDPGYCGATVTYIAPVGTDNCPGTVTTVQTAGLPSGSFFPVDTTINTFVTSDALGNSDTCSFMVIVTDNELPVFSCPFAPYGIVRAADSGVCTAYVTVPMIDPWDNCSVDSVANDFNGTADASGDYPVGITTVTWTVWDVNGNTNICKDYIHVVDDQTPTVVTQDITVYLNSSGFAAIVPADIDNGSFDNCSIIDWSLSQTMFTCANVGIPNIVTLTVTDTNGNQAAGTATVTVLDTIAPEVFCSNIIVQLDPSGNAVITPDQVFNNGYDICGLGTMTVTPNTFTCLNIGQNIVTLTVSDLSGNTATCNAIVIVQDVVPPVALCQNITVYLDETGIATIDANDIDNGSYDDCAILGMVAAPFAFTCFNIGDNDVILAVADISGNISYCTAVVTVIDTISPVAACQNITVELDASGNATITPEQVDNGSSDACGIASMSVSPNSFTCANLGWNIVTLTVTDENGNTATCTSIVNIIDVTPPVAVCQSITVQLDATGNASITAAQINNGSYDACGIDEMTVTPNTFTCDNVGANMVTLTVSDISGNVSTCNALVTVEDVTPPMALCQNITVSLDASGFVNITAAQVDNGSSDNCGIATMTVAPDAFTCSNVGQNTVTLTVTDVYGNVSTCTAVVTIQDATPPVAVCQDITITLDATGNASITASQINNGSSDACGISTITVAPDAFTCANVGPNTVTLTVTDQNGNTSTCTATVTVHEVIPPVAICQNITVQLDATGNVSITAAQINNGSYDNCGIDTITVAPYTFTCANVGANMVVLTVTDVDGNISTCDALVTVEDATPPTALCHDITVQLDASGFVNITASQVDNGSSDNCGIATMTVAPDAFTCSSVGANTVTLTVTDTYGNVSTCTAVVTVQDATPPVAICQDITITLDATGNASITASQINNGSSDACGISTITVTPDAFTCANVGPNTVTLTVTDQNGNTSTCTATVTVHEVIPPVAICQNITVQLDATGNVSITAAQINNGSYDNCGIDTITVAPYTFTCANVGANMVVLTVTDVDGNISTCDALVTVEDATPPTALCHDITVQLDASGFVNITAAQVDNGSSDNCGIATMTVAPDAFTCSNVGPNTVTLTVTDVYGNVSTCTAIVTVQDATLPVAVCQDITVQLDASGNASITASQINNGSSDACGIESITVSPNTFTCANVGANTVTLTVTDNNGNTSVCTATVTVEDATPPTALCQNITVQLDATGNASITAVQINNGSYDNCGIDTITVAPYTFTCANVGANMVLLTVTDVNGNVSTCDALVTVEDATPPTALCQDITVQLDASGFVNITAAQVDNGSSDNCGIATMTVAPDAFTCSNVGPNTVTLTVTDVYGNVSTCTAIVTVQDATLPVAVCQDITVQLDASGNASITASQIDNGSSDACGIESITVSPNTFTCANVGANTVTLTVTDNSGNTSICTATVTVEDATPPTALCQNITVQLDATGNVSITAAQINNGSYDNCGIDTITVAPYTFTCANVGANMVLLTVTDVNGNVSTCDALVTVVDPTMPTALCQNITVQLDASGFVNITAAQVDNGSSDNCGIATMTVAPDAFTCSNVGPNTVTLTVTDVYGNVSTCTAIITVQDATLPVAVCQDITVQLDVSGNASITASQINNGSSDACGIESITVSPNTFTCSNVGQNMVTLTVTDMNGNSSICTATVVVEDVNPPTAICQSITVQLDATGQASITAAQINNGSSDNCGIDTMYVAPDSFTCADLGANMVILTVIDVNGNTSTCNALVTVEDAAAPVALCHDITVQLDASGFVTITPDMVDNGSSDLCGIASMTVSPHAFTCSNVGANTVTLTVTDVSGNTSTCTATVTVQDVTPPVALCQNVTVTLNGAGVASITASQINNGSNDACGIDSMTVAPSTFTCANVGQNTVTLTVTDVNGNTATCTATVTVQDVVPPVAICQNIIVQLDGQGIATVTAAQINNGSYDNCGIDTMTVSPTTFTCANIGQNIVALTVTDVGGNMSTCYATVTVEDTTAPVALCHDIILQLNPSGFASLAPGQINNGSSDNCGIASVTVYPNTFTCSNVGANTVTMTVYDYHGNVSTCTATVTVLDVTPPVAVCQNLTIPLDASGFASITASQINNGSNDACGIDTMSVVPNVFTCADIGVNLVTLTVVDVNGNVSACTANVTVVDVTPPIAVCQNLTVQLNDQGNASITAAQINNGSHDACGIDTMTIYPSVFTCANIGSNLVTLTVTDVNGNVSTCNALVNVEDTIVPTAICHNITIQLDAMGLATISAGQINDGSYDACGIATVTVEPNTFDCTNVGANTVVLTVTDVNGNVSTCTATVTVEDVTPPVAMCHDLTVQLDATGNAVIIPADINNGSTDICGIDSLSVIPNTFTCSNVGPNSVALIVIDVNGNMAVCNSTVTVVDVTPPVAVCQNITLPLNAQGTASITAGDINNGSYDACGIDTMTVSQSIFTCDNVGANMVILTVTDVNGNVSTCNALVTVEDVTPPTAICQNINLYLNASGNANITAAQIDNGSADACGIASMVVSPSAFTCANVGPNNVTLTVTDVNGNVSSCTAIVNVLDTVHPVAICQDIIAQLNINGTVTITGEDVDNGSYDACGIGSLVVTPSTFTCSDIGTHTVTLTVTDVNGNSSTCTATVTVEDKVPPTAICQNINVYLDNDGLATITTAQINYGSSDACGIASMSVYPSSFNCANIGSNIVVLTVTDVNGNVSTCSSEVTVLDTIPPSIFCPSDVLVNSEPGGCEISGVQLGFPTFSDNCLISLIINNNADSTFSVGTTLVTWTITDGSGNTATCIQTVYVESAPLAVNDTVITGENTPVVIPVLDNDLDCENNLDPSTVIVITPPANGTVTVDPVTGDITYTPDYLFTGNDQFTYQVCDSTGLCTTATVFVTVLPMNNPQIGIAKAVYLVTPADDNSFNITYVITVENLGNDLIENIQVTDNLANIFGAPVTFTVVNPPNTNNDLTPNSHFNGTTDIDLLESRTSHLHIGNSATITFTINVHISGSVQTFCNTATVTGRGSKGSFVMDISDNGYIVDANGNGIANEQGENDCTPVTLTPYDVFIPQAISPDGDGKNDFFVIRGIELYPDNELTIYNRWGNEVFNMSKYDNSWDGKSDNALSMGGNKLPEGTYFYIFEYNKDNRPPRKGYVVIKY